MRNTPTIAEETDEEWTRILNTNLNGVFYCTREEVRAMKGLPAGDRSIVNVGSIAGVSHMPDVYAYGTSKGACAYFTTCVAADAFPLGIRVNNVSPGGLSPAPSSAWKVIYINHKTLLQESQTRQCFLSLLLWRRHLKK
jgi:chanoclavine-I dehydrogenase